LDGGVVVLIADGEGLVVSPGVPLADGVAELSAAGVSEGVAAGGGAVSSGSNGALGGGGTYCGIGGNAPAEAVTVRVL
jgi:hypothetical protein